MIEKWKNKLITLFSSISFFIFTLQVKAFAVTNSTPINTGFNPTANKTTVDGLVGHVMQWLVGAIASIAGAWFLFHLYLAVTKFMASSHNAQKREDAKSHMIHVIVAGVLGGAAVVIASAVWNWGAAL